MMMMMMIVACGPAEEPAWAVGCRQLWSVLRVPQ